MPSNLPLLESAASKLRHLLDEVVFVGGSTLDLIVTDQASAPIRPTEDVDVVVEITTYGDYVIFSDKLRWIGFQEDTRQGAPLCRWVNEDLTLDVMPLDKAILGFSNRWYPGAMTTARPASLPSGKVIRLVTAPFFLGTKMEAFRNRGNNDYFGSHDLEDFIAVVEGREALLDEMPLAPVDLRLYLSEQVTVLLADSRFHDALPGYVPGDFISQRRVPLIVRRLRALTEAV
jgi:hypothetical protein